MTKLINNESIFSHRVTRNTDLFDYLKNDLIVSMRLTNKLIKTKKLFINAKPVKKNIHIKIDEIVKIEFEDESHNYEEIDLPLDIVFEDNDIIVINKEPHLVVHPTKSHHHNTIANRIAYYFREKNLNRKIRFVNRLDMDTSGLLIVAKNPYAHQYLAKQFEKNTVIKEYLAFVNGKLEDKHGVINQPIKKDEDTGKYIVDSNGKSSVTEFEVIKEMKDHSLVKCRLKSGRTHQIRVHLSTLGHPIISDSLYGEKSDLIKRQALHSHCLILTLPRSKKQIKLAAPIPDDFKQL
ncbi:RluA family pseudouridine synthase [Haloplasma contractile]|uniref:Pseudouridine synthase n=1 Tax=Haloplasma contractile SSD-17B TaxID=1033810 RepID=U2EBK4_9MOLU|nr:RluA family pseudouridine synthase [Haloplasma contractile]ERJ12453.1 Pseudouridine synthase protein [Haloplasma contractile SSD-17B]